MQQVCMPPTLTTVWAALPVMQFWMPYLSGGFNMNPQQEILLATKHSSLNWSYHSTAPCTLCTCRACVCREQDLLFMRLLSALLLNVKDTPLARATAR